VTDLPTILYRCPGPHSGPGYTWASLGVSDEAAYDAALAAGWHPTLPEAVDALRSPPAPVVVSLEPEPVDDNAAPTRAEIEAKAAELGIAVHHKHKDETILQKIEEALAAKEAADGLEQA
jgi:hypothetical protein